MASTSGGSSGPSGSTQQTLQLRVVGDAGTGKTSLIHRYVTGSYNQSPKLTVGADFSKKMVKFDGCDYTVLLWDLAGQYRSSKDTTAQFFRKSDAVMICCHFGQDLSNSLHVQEWRQMVYDHCPEAPCVLNVTQIDRYTPDQRWQDKFIEGGFDAFFQTSAKDDVGVEEAFRELIRLAVFHSHKRATLVGTDNSIDAARYAPSYSVEITSENSDRTSKNCCGKR